MKRATMIIAVIVVILAGGGLFYSKQFTQNSESSAPKTTHTSKPKSQFSKKATDSEPAKSEIKTSSSTQSSSQEQSTTKAKSTSSSGSSSSSVSSSSEPKKEATPKTDTGNAGKVKNGAGAMGDHKVEGQEVTKPTIDAIKKRMDSLGYNSSAWSPQDVINMYRKASDNGHTTADSITKEDIESYLKK